MTVEDLLKEVNSLDCPETIDRAIDVLFDTVDEWLCDGQFAECDRLLELTNINEISSSLCCAFLTITCAARKKLKNRDRFYRDAFQRVVELRGEDAAKNILDGLA